MSTAYQIESGTRAGSLGAAMYHGMKIQRRTSTAMMPASWRRRAADAYFVVARDRVAELRNDLAERIQRLIGRSVAAESVYADAGQRLAVARVDDVVFRCQHGVLQIVRPCVHCGTGEFCSPTIEGLADLGYAMEAWQPRCTHCEPADSESWIYED